MYLLTNTEACVAVTICMTDQERIIITSVWNDMSLRRKLDDDPYSLTQNELKALKNNDRLNTQLKCLLKDAFIRKALLRARSL